MAAAISEPRINTLDKFFTKIVKKEIVNEECSKLNNLENSDSEFEMVHNGKKDVSEKKTNRTSNLNKSVIYNSNESEDSDFANNELAEISKVSNLGRAATRNQVGRRVSTDSFSSSDDSRDNVVQKQNNQISEVKSSKPKPVKVPEHSISDEDDIIPDSQEPTTSFQFDLSSAKLANKRRSQTLRKDSSSNDTSSEKSSSSDIENRHDSVPESPKGNIDSQGQIWLEGLMNKINDVTKLTNKKGINTLHYNEICEDDEIFLIQCPKEIDPKSFINKEIVLIGNSSISVKKEKVKTIYDYCAINESCDQPQRHVNLITPNKNLSDLHLETVFLNGNIIISESITVPKLELPPVSPPKKVQYPEKLEQLCLSLPDADSPSDPSNYGDNFSSRGFEDTSEQNNKTFHDSAMETLISNLKKSKKKRKFKEEHSFSSDTEYPKKKKHKINDEELNQSTELFNNSVVEALITDSHRKKKMKKIKEPEYETNSFEESTLQIKQEPEELLQDIDVEITKKKKKKSKKRESECETSPLNIKQEPEKSSQDIDFEITKKKKKKSKCRDQ